MRKSKRILALLMMAAMVVMMISVASAEKKYDDKLVVDDDNDETNGLAYEPVTVITKNLIIENGANIPGVTFAFTATVPDADHCSSENDRLVCDATANTLAVIKGLNPDSIVWKNENQSSGSIMIGAIEYKAQAKDTAAPDVDGDYVTITEGRAGSAEDEDYYTATKKISLDFSGVGFDEPGVYRYIITEQWVSVEDDVQGIISDPNVTGDDNCKRTLDVYVIDAGVNADGAAEPDDPGDVPPPRQEADDEVRRRRDEPEGRVRRLLHGGEAVVLRPFFFPGFCLGDGGLQPRRRFLYAGHDRLHRGSVGVEIGGSRGDFFVVEVFRLRDESVQRLRVSRGLGRGAETLKLLFEMASYLIFHTDPSFLCRKYVRR